MQLVYINKTVKYTRAISFILLVHHCRPAGQLELARRVCRFYRALALAGDAPAGGAALVGGDGGRPGQRPGGPEFIAEGEPACRRSRRRGHQSAAEGLVDAMLEVGYHPHVRSDWTQC